jgi:hypothetical protein
MGYLFDVLGFPRLLTAIVSAITESGKRTDRRIYIEKRHKKNSGRIR